MGRIIFHMEFTPYFDQFNVNRRNIKMRAKTNFEVLFNAKTEHLYRELESAKRNYEFAVKEFITSHLIPDREFEEAYENEWRMLRDAYIGDPYIEGYEVLASIIYSHISWIEDEQGEDLPEEVLTV